MAPAKSNPHAVAMPPPAVQLPYGVRLGLVLQILRVTAVGVRPTPSQAMGLVQWEAGASKPGLSALEDLAALYRVPLLSLLAGPLDVEADLRRPLGGRHAPRLVSAVRTFDRGNAPSASSYRRALGDMLKALREHRERLGGEAPKLPLAPASLASFESGTWRPSWSALHALCDAYGAGPLALLAYAADPVAIPPVDSLIACRKTMILDPAQPDRTTRLRVPDAQRIAAALREWAEAVGMGRAVSKARRLSDHVVPPRPDIGERAAVPPPADPAPDPYAEALGQALAALREQVGLTRSEAADRINVPVELLEACEGPDGLRRRDVVILCCRAYGVSALALLVHLATPASTALPASVGGGDAPRILTALSVWTASAVRRHRNTARSRYCRRIAEVLPPLRSALGLSRADVSRETGVSIRAIQSLERNYRQLHPRLRVLNALAARYGVGLLPLLAHLADPTWPLDRPLGGPDADRIAAALLIWDTDRPAGYRPPAPVTLVTSRAGRASG